LTQRSKSKDTYPGEWSSSVGGHVIYGDTYDDTAKRELDEELSVDADLKLIDKIPVNFETEKEVVAIYGAVSRETPKADPTEVEQVKLFDFNKIVKKFSTGEFKLSGSSQKTFAHVIKNGSLKKYYDSILKKGK